MHSILFRRGAATLALATAASLAAVGGTVATSEAAPAGPAVATVDRAGQRITTHLTVTAPRTLPADGTGKVKGRLTARRVPLADRAVRLLVKRDGAERWTLGRVRKTDRQGRVGFAISPDSTASYRLWYAGSGRFEPDRSRVVTVAPRTTVVTVAASPAVVDPGGSATVSGAVADEGSPLVGAPVQLRARKAGTSRAFEPVATTTTGADGSVSFTVAPVRSTAYVLVVPRTETSQAGRSAVTKVVVKAGTRLAVRARTVGDTFSVVGSLRSRGDGLRGRQVTLQSQAAGATEWTAVRTKRTGRDGYVAYRRAAVEGTSYRLVYAGTATLGASTSRTVVA